MQRGKLPVQAQNLLLTVSQSQFAFEKRGTSFSKLIFKFLNIHVSLFNLIDSFLLKVLFMLILHKHLLRLFELPLKRVILLALFLVQPAHLHSVNLKGLTHTHY